MKLSIARQINGWMSDVELEQLALFSKDATSILEIGSFQGRSTRAICDNSPKGTPVDAVDCWDYRIRTVVGEYIDVDAQAYSIFCANLADHLKSGKLLPYRVLFKNFVPPRLYDFIFIDGSHDEANVRHDIEKSLGMMKQGGIISGHDYQPGFPGVVKAVDSFFKKVESVDTIWHVRID